MAKKKELKNALKDKIIAAMEPILSSLHGDAFLKIKKKVKNASSDISKSFFKEIDSIERKKDKAESKKAHNLKKENKKNLSDKTGSDITGADKGSAKKVDKPKVAKSDSAKSKNVKISPSKIGGTKPKGKVKAKG